MSGLVDITMTDLTPWQQACWDRDRVPEALESLTDWKIIRYTDGPEHFPYKQDKGEHTPNFELAVQFYQGVCEDGTKRGAGWVAWVEDPFPRWETSSWIVGLP